MLHFLSIFVAYVEGFDTAVVPQEKVVVKNIPDLCNSNFLFSIPRITSILVKISFIFHEFLIKFSSYYSNNKYLIQMVVLYIDVIVKLIKVNIVHFYVVTLRSYGN